MNAKLTYPILILLTFSFVFLSAQKVDLSQVHGMAPRNIGPAGMSGRVTAIEVDLNDMDNIYLGTAAGGIFKSENSGHTFQPIFENELAASIGDIAIYPKNPNIIYVGTGEGNPRNSQNSGWGMYKSIDGGRNWEHLGLEQTRQIHRVIVHPDNPKEVVIGVSGASWGDSEHRGVYKSVDGGKTWKKTLYINQKNGCSDLVADPANPSKLIAGMWEHRRWPWYFNSGGPSSGIYMSLDGGDNWKALDETNGLPKGDLGRIGLAFAPTNSDIVYAYIESQENAIYRSEDGGFNWKRVSQKKQPIGGRPFYYADIYVDSKNENRVYSIATTVNVSEDGGKTWSIFAPGNQIHTDHHAWWAHPEDSDFLMVGHDGGLNITHDRGKNWWFADNLPLAQFYHIRVDNEVPYNVYGGLQDNGSWVGPSQTRFKGGIRNMYWQRLSVGDGFDVVPDPMDANYGYAMGQAGNLVRYDRRSGYLKKIKPIHPKGEYLRFNWNTGIAIDPFDKKTIYYGSQYLLKTSDYGQSWEFISPDLTTNDPEKTKALESGGLTYDVTGAENHCSIIAIAPSPLEEGVIWTGSDDGKVFLTKDGGKNWTDLTQNIRGVPASSWVTQIQPSKHKTTEAFVVFDDHRRNNWTPYIFRTNDFGQTWERIVSRGNVRGYTYCIEQDPVEPNLYFCGTEFGFYVSFDAGQNWNKWNQGFPTVPVTDMVIHPRDHDLVLGTFGRSIWILDDIRPLRSIAQQGARKLVEKPLSIFPSPEAYLINIGESIGYRKGKIGDALYEGTNRKYGALITYYAKEAGEKTVEIQNEAGNVIRNLRIKAKAGINRFNWNLSRNAERLPNQPKPKNNAIPKDGKFVPPGIYKIVIKDQSTTARGEVVVKIDPLLEITSQAIAEKEQMIQEHYKAIQLVTGVMDDIRTLEEDLELIQKKFWRLQEGKKNDLLSQVKPLKKELQSFKEKIVGKEVQGIYRRPETISTQLYQTNYLLDEIWVAPSKNQKIQLQHSSTACEGLVREFTYFREKLLPFRKALSDNNILWLE